MPRRTDRPWQGVHGAAQIPSSGRPASCKSIDLGHEQLPPAYDYARPALRTLEAEMSPEDLAAARDAAAHATLAELVHHALAAAPALTAAPIT